MMYVGNENSEQRALRRMRNAERDRQDELYAHQRQLQQQANPHEPQALAARLDRMEQQLAELVGQPQRSGHQ